jgi:GT2 family glycosyltransferase
MIDLSIILVSYNTKSFIHDAVSSLLDTIHTITYEIIVVDNASTDGSVEMLKHEFPTVKVIASKDNLGFAKANNKGVTLSKGKYVLFLNPDTITHPRTIEHIYHFMEEHLDAGAATCKLVMLQGQMDYATHRGFPTPWNSLCYFSGLTKLFPKSKLFSGYTQGWKDLTQTHTIDALAGAFMFVRRSAGEEVNWWDEDYFFNGEDLDFCYKLGENEWKIYYVPQVSILHYNGVSGGTKKDTQNITTANVETKRFVTKHRFEAMKIFYKKHYKKKYPKFMTWLVMKGIDFKLQKTLTALK